MRESLVPTARKQGGLFTAAQAVASGYTRHAINHRLRSGRWQRVQYGVYAEQSTSPTFPQRCAAAILAGPAGSAITGPAAVRLHGVTALNRHDAIQIRVPYEATVKSSQSVGVIYGPAPTVFVRGVAVVSAAYACLEVARGPNLPLAVAVLDEALRRQVVSYAGLEQEWASLPHRARGRKRARRGLDLADPQAESPPESILRVTIILSGLPIPTLQWVITNEQGAFIARTDLAYPELKIAIEYDGAATHRDDPATFRDDRRRQNKLIAAGWTVLRFTAADLFGNPQGVVATIRAAVEVGLSRDRSVVGR